MTVRSLPFGYADEIENHTIRSVNDEDIHISKNNKHFKFISLFGINKAITIHQENFQYFITMRNTLKDSPIEFIMLFSGGLNQGNVNMLKDFSKLHDYAAAEIDTSFLERVYHLHYHNCKFSVLLDGNNQVRLTVPERFDDAETIIRRELQKGTLNNRE